MSDFDDGPDLHTERINLDTGRIAWMDLQRYFAAGRVIVVGDGLDLVNVAQQFTQDNKGSVDAWIKQGKIDFVSDDQAKAWVTEDAELWAVVVSPWVLVQDIEK